MADAEYYFSAGDVRKQRGVNRRVLGGRGSQKPRARRRRGRVSQGSTLQKLRTTSSISAATSLTSMGTGAGVLLNADGTDDGDEIDIDNPGFDTFDERSIMWVNTAMTPPQVVSVFCTQHPEA